MFVLFSECGRTIPGVLKGTKMMKLYVDDSPDRFKGSCLFFVRARNDLAVNVKTMHEVFFSIVAVNEIPNFMTDNDSGRERVSNLFRLLVGYNYVL